MSCNKYMYQPIGISLGLGSIRGLVLGSFIPMKIMKVIWSFSLEYQYAVGPGISSNTRYKPSSVCIN